VNRWLLSFAVLAAIVCAVALLTHHRAQAPAPARQAPQSQSLPQAAVQPPAPRAPETPEPPIPDTPAPQESPKPVANAIPGRVVDEKGNPVPHATIAILTLDGNESSQESADDGTFALPPLNNQPPYIIQCSHPDFVFFELEKLVTPPCEPITITLAKAPVVEGVVVDAFTNAPIRAFSLRINTNELDDVHDGELEFDDVEDPNGRFRLACTTPNSTLVIRCEGYTDFTQRLFPESGRKISITAAMQPFAIINATVRNPEGEPVPDAAICLDGVTKEHAYRTNEEGNVTFQNTPGPCTLHVTANGYAPAQVDVLCEPRREHPVDVELNRGLSLVGTVTRNGVPQAGIHLSAKTPESPWTDTHVTRTDDNGDYEITGLAPGLVAVHALIAEGDSRQDYSAITPVSAPNGGRADIDLSFESASIAGTIRNYRNEPFPAHLSIQTTLPNGLVHCQTAHASDGSYAVDNVPAGDVSVIASQDNAVERRNLRLAPNARMQCDFVLGGTGRITGRVLGNLDAGTAVVLYPSSCSQDSIRMANSIHDVMLCIDGMAPLKGGTRFFAFENLKPGEYTLMAMTTDAEPRSPTDFFDTGRNATVTVSVTADSPAHVDIEIP